VFAEYLKNQIRILLCYHWLYGTRGGAVCWGSALQTGRSQVRIPFVSLI